ncbi:hypothetical protein CVU75_01430 [Candidatus Dependentiae bacterium HGW-Dependentiae-1]|nr:MAG: hypothetical protein CVU75_01430 [Candidatus Dependentiae bacterium HGW-Dependentiae-1]
MKKLIVFLVCANLTFFAGADRAGWLGTRRIAVQKAQQKKPVVAAQACTDQCSQKFLPASVPSDSVTFDPIVVLVKKKIFSFMRRYKIPGVAVVLYAHGKPYLFHCGYADRDAKVPVTEKTLFEVGSITKLFTCLLVAQEVLAGTLSLTASIRDYIPTLQANRRLKNMTLERLATHTATLPFNVPESINTKEKFLSYVARWRTPCTASLAYVYSNPSIELLRCALEETTGKSFQDLLVHRILLPLGMSRVGIAIPEGYATYCARCYDKMGKLTKRWHHPLLLGSAALRASSIDMLAFLKAAIGLPGTPERVVAAMHLTQTPHVYQGNASIGLGWCIRDLQILASVKKRSGPLFKNACVCRVKKNKQVFNGHAFFDKTGTTEGFHAYIAAMPSYSKGIVVMMNRTLPKGWKVASKLGREILLRV